MSSPFTFLGDGHAHVLQMTQHLWALQLCLSGSVGCQLLPYVCALLTLSIKTAQGAAQARQTWHGTLLEAGVKMGFQHEVCMLVERRPSKR